MNASSCLCVLGAAPMLAGGALHVWSDPFWKKRSVNFSTSMWDLSEWWN